MENSIVDFVRCFIIAFAGATAKKNLATLVRKVVKGKLYLWQIPAKYESTYYEGKDAMSAFDQAKKDNSFEFVFDGPLSDKMPAPLSNNHRTALGIYQNGPIEFYVFDQSFNWCYVVTHEGMACGPFFFVKRDE